MDWNPPWSAPENPTEPHRYRYLYGLTPTVVWARQTAKLDWLIWDGKGAQQDMRDQCFRDRYRLVE
jgi:hypothetical protein